MYALLFKTINWALNTVSVQGSVLIPRQGHTGSLPHSHEGQMYAQQLFILLRAMLITKLPTECWRNSVITKLYRSHTRPQHICQSRGRVVLRSDFSGIEGWGCPLLLLLLLLLLLPPLLLLLLLLLSHQRVLARVGPHRGPCVCLLSVRMPLSSLPLWWSMDNGEQGGRKGSQPT